MAHADILTDHLHAAQFQYPLKLPDIFQAISIGNKIEHNLNPISFKQIEYLFFQECLTIQ